MLISESTLSIPTRIEVDSVLAAADLTGADFLTSAVGLAAVSVSLMSVSVATCATFFLLVHHQISHRIV